MEPTLLTTGEAAKALRVHPVTLRRWVEEGILPARRVGKRLRFDEKELAALIKPVANEPQKQAA